MFFKHPSINLIQFTFLKARIQGIFMLHLAFVAEKLWLHLHAVCFTSLYMYACGETLKESNPQKNVL